MGKLGFEFWEVMGSLMVPLAAITACSAATEGGGTGGANSLGAGGGTAGTGSPDGTGGINGTAGTSTSGGTAGAAGANGGTGGAGGGGASGGGGNGGGTAGAGGGGGGAEKIVSPTCDGQDCWTYLGRDAHSTFFNSLETKITVANAKTLTQFWKTDTGSTATGTAAVVGDTVYFMAQNNTRAFNRATGDQKWNVPSGGSSSITWDAGKLYVQHPKGDVLRLDAATGGTDWTVAVNGPGNSVGTPFVFGNLVVVGTSSSEEWSNQSSSFVGRVRAIDKDTHAEVWHFDTIKGAGNGAPVWSSQSADADLGMIYITTGNNYYALGGDSDSIVALDAKTGGRLWAFQAKADDLFNGFQSTLGADYDFGANPVVFNAGGKKLVGAGSKGGIFYAVDRTNGHEAWRRQITTGCALGGILNNGAYDGQRIYVSSFPCTTSQGFPPGPFSTKTLTAGTPILAALNPATGEVIWQKNMPAQSWAPLTVANGVLFAPSQNIMQAFDASNGTLLLSFTAAGSICSGAAVVDGKVYFGAGVPPADTLSLGGAQDGSTLYALSLP